MKFGHKCRSAGLFASLVRLAPKRATEFNNRPLVAPATDLTRHEEASPAKEDETEDDVIVNVDGKLVWLGSLALRTPFDQTSV